MKKTYLVLGIVSSVLLSSCSVSEGIYTPAYNNDYVYSVGYYGYRPYWSGGYNSGYGWGVGNTGYWPGYRSYNSSYQPITGYGRYQEPRYHSR